MVKLFIQTKRMSSKSSKEKAQQDVAPEVVPITHIVFQEADITVLQEAMALDQSFGGDVIQIRDEFAVGPLEGLDDEEGWNNRVSWWRELIEISPYPNNLVGSFDDRKTVKELKQKLEEDEKVQLWIWVGQNGHDVCGYYWLISQLKEYEGRVLILYLNNLPFITEKGQLFYPTALHQIQPKEFLKAKKLCRRLTGIEFEGDGDEWKKLCTENSLIRILEGGKKIGNKEVSFYDNDILAGLTSEPQKGARAMHQILSKMKLKTGDVFLLWRMKALEREGKLQISGDPSKGWKEFEVTLKTIPSQEE